MNRREIIRLTIDGKEVQNEEVYSIAVQSYYFSSIDKFFGISLEEAGQIREPEELASSMQSVLVEYLDDQDYIKLEGERRFLIH